MQSCTSLLQQFSSFAIVEENSFRSWLVDPRLHKSMERCLAQAAAEAAEQDLKVQMSDRFWALYWYRHWLNCSHPLAEAHLSAYLQETCYWLAQKLHRKMRRSGATSQYSLADLFQMTALELRPVLKSFDPSKGNLKSFAQVALRYRLCATIRAQQLAGFCGPWGLLRNSTQKSLLAALKGRMAAEVERKRLLFLGFGAIYAGAQPKHGGQLPAPTLEQLQAIAQFYNEQRSSQLSHIAPTLSTTAVQQELEDSSQALRDYLYPMIPSLNEAHFECGKSGDRVEKQEMLDDQNTPLPWEKLLAQEQQQERAEHREQWRRLVQAQFENFSEQVQQIVCLTYVGELTQQKIAKQLNIPQPRISHRLRDARQAIIEAMLAEYGAVDNFPKPHQLKEVKQQLTECLKLHLPELGCCDACQGLAEDDSASSSPLSS